MEFKDEVVDEWQSFWSHLCRMAYLREDIVEELIATPISEHDHVVYTKYPCYEIHLDKTWKDFSEKYLQAQVVPELKKIFVPMSLFECLGVSTWFRHSFPNCKIVFWEDESN